MATEKMGTTLSGMAGEFLTAGQLLKRDLLVTVTMGNAKAIDLLVYNPKKQMHFSVQVKTRAKQPSKKVAPDSFGWFLRKVDKSLIYVFVILNSDKPSEREEYFVVKGETLADNYARFFGSECDPNNPGDFDGVGRESVQEFKDNWPVFLE